VKLRAMGIGTEIGYRLICHDPQEKSKTNKHHLIFTHGIESIYVSICLFDSIKRLCLTIIFLNAKYLYVIFLNIHSCSLFCSILHGCCKMDNIKDEKTGSLGCKTLRKLITKLLKPGLQCFFPLHYCSGLEGIAMWRECLLRGMEPREPRKMWQRETSVWAQRFDSWTSRAVFWRPVFLPKWLLFEKRKHFMCPQRRGGERRFGCSHHAARAEIQRMGCSGTGQTSLP
jgi:hypothetical protein